MQELIESQNAILLTEEVLLEALCFDFVIRSPHIDLIDLLEARRESPEFEEYAFTIANDSSVPPSCPTNLTSPSKKKDLEIHHSSETRLRYRTPLCVLYPPRIIAVACYVLTQQYIDGAGSLSLTDRLASPAPSASLPTPPSQKPPHPESMRFAVDFYKLNETELASVAGKFSKVLSSSSSLCMCLCRTHRMLSSHRGSFDITRVLCRTRHELDGILDKYSLCKFIDLDMIQRVAYD